MAEQCDRPEPDDRDAGTVWLTSSFSGGVNCVAVARLAGDRIGVRHSRRPEVAPHVFTRSEWAAFVAGVKNGDFDQV